MRCTRKILKLMDMWFNWILVIQLGSFVASDSKFNVTYELSNDIIYNSM